MTSVRMLAVFALLAALLPAAVACGGEEEVGGPEPDAVVLRMLYGSEKETWLTDVTERFNAGDYETTGGRPIYVEATPMGSGESMNLILGGQADADIWSPASSLYLALASEEWAKEHGGEEMFDESSLEPLVLSPVVIGIWRPMAEALGWPDEQIGWRELADLVASGRTWADYGHPEWGAFQFGHTHPDYSNSGLTTIAGLAYAGAGKKSDLTVDDVRSRETQDLIRGVEQSVIHYGESTGFFADTMFERGPSYLSAAVMYENLVIESYDESLHPNVAQPVVAIYPEEGSFYSDHPFVVLNSSEKEKKAAAEIYREFLTERPRQEIALKYGFRPANVDVGIDAPVDTAHGVDPAQLRDELPVPSAEVIRATREVWRANKKRVDVAVVLDTSGSMQQEDRLIEAQDALVEFLEGFQGEDRVSLTAFSTDAYDLSPLTPIGPKREELRSSVMGTIPQGDTRLYDTTAEVYEALDGEPAGERIRAVVVLTDGQDNQSQRSLEELVGMLRADEEGSSIKVFTIAYGSDASLEALRRISEASGAIAYSGDTENIQVVYDDIATFF